jgi:hypothetical protein
MEIKDSTTAKEIEIAAPWVMCQDEVKTIHLSLIMHLEVSNEANL